MIPQRKHMKDGKGWTEQVIAFHARVAMFNARCEDLEGTAALAGKQLSSTTLSNYLAQVEGVCKHLSPGFFRSTTTNSGTWHKTVISL